MTKYKLTGIQKLDYTSKKTGNPAVAYKLFSEYMDSRIQGKGCADFFVAEHIYKENPIKLGDTFVVSTNNGFVSAIIPLA